MGKGGGGGGRSKGRQQGGGATVAEPSGDGDFKKVYMSEETYNKKVEEMKEYEPNGTRKELEDLLALKRYTNVDYGFINAYLRTGSEESIKNAYALKGDNYKNKISYADFKNAALNQIKKAENALSRMPVFKGTVIRGTDINPDNYKVGQTVTEKGFTSTTKNSNYGGDVKFVIQSKTGRDIDRISDYKGSENEVLFKPGTKFKVTKKESINGRPHIYMSEN